MFEINKIEIDLQAIPTTSYTTPAKRLGFSVLDKSKIKRVVEIEIRDWQENLKQIH